jgi:c-di-GMP-binding flagellar brake protein YcgR
MPFFIPRGMDKDTNSHHEAITRGPCMEISRWIRKDCFVQVSPGLEGECWYPSHVVSVGSGSFSIVRPAQPEGTVPGPAGKNMRIRVPSSEGLLQFTCSVLLETLESEARIELGFPLEVVHLERRAYTRLPIRIETQYAEIRDGSAGLSFSKSTALDISGGGIRLETNRVCPQETLLRVKFQIPLGQMEEELILTGRIVRSVPGEGARRSQVGVEFIDISPRQQETLVQYTLDRTKDQPLQA